VHGGEARKHVKILSEKIDFRAFVNRIEELLRSSIKEFMLLCEGKTELQVINLLDERVLYGLKV